MPVTRHQRPEDDTGLDMTPMLDIVFIMLIFFIVTTSFVKESGITVNAPGAATADKQDNATLFIGINEQGQVWIDKRQVDIRTVRSIVARLHAENPEGSVVVQADRKADTDYLVQVMDQVRMAGVRQIAVAAAPE